MFHDDSKIVLITGCFHILHPGHLDLIEYAYSLGNVYVGINTDQYLIKKSSKIIIQLSDRIRLINSIKYVSKVIAFPEENASELIRRVHPNIFMKGPDYRGRRIKEQDVCEELGIQYICDPQIKIYNTSDIINKS